MTSAFASPPRLGGVLHAVVRRLPVWALAGVLSACAATGPGADAADAREPGPVPPRLVVLLVVDGLPQWQVTAWRDQLAPDGLRRLLDHGAWAANAHYGHAFTVTAAGHATMLTGAYPHRTGIVGNNWRDRATGADVYCTMDTMARYIGHATQPLDGTSPRNLRAETLGDVLRRASPQSRVIGISGKDRGAILPAGLTGTAYMYMASTGQFASSTHYMAQHPDWVTAFNGARPADRYFRQTWKPLLPDAAYAADVPDRQPWFGKGPAALPMDMADTDQPAPTPAFYASLLRSPFADALTLDFARAAVAGERLGQRGVTDLLSVSVSGHDYVNHVYSAESRMSHDHLLQLDRQFEAFFQFLDATVGRDAYVLAFTSDHGFQPAPEVARARGMADAARVDLGAVRERVNARLVEAFGAGTWVRSSGATLLVNREPVAVHGKGLTVEAVADLVRDRLRAEPAIAAAYSARELRAGRADAGGDEAPYFRQVLSAWHPEVSGDVQYVLRPNQMPTNVGATHGTPHAYDTHVPLMFYGPRWIAPGRFDAPAEVVDLAPTLADLLRLPPPAASEGRVLPVRVKASAAQQAR